MVLGFCMYDVYKKIRSIKDPSFFEQIVSFVFETILAIATFLSSFNNVLKYFIIGLIIFYCIYTIYRVVNLWNKHTKNIFSDNDEIKEYMKKWIDNDGQTVIVTRDLSWVDVHDEIFRILLKKARCNELTIIMREAKDDLSQLENEGAKIFYYSHLDFTPENRFTFIHHGRSNPRLAIGYQDGDVRIIKEFEKSGTIEYSLAEDLYTLLKEVSKNESNSTEI